MNDSETGSGPERGPRADAAPRHGADPAAGPGADPAEEAAHAEPNYLGVWLGLFVLTVAEVGVAFLSGLPKSVIILMLVGMAIWKALLVALYYMHLRFEPNRLRLVALAPLPLAVIMVLAILMEYR